MPGLTSRDVQTTLNYFSKTVDGKQPYNYTYELPAGQLTTNIESEAHPVTVQDARGRESEFNVDDNGFTFLTSPAEEKLFEDEEAITTRLVSSSTNRFGVFLEPNVPKLHVRPPIRRD